jgi:superfamily II DNA helicase RecQ
MLALTATATPRVRADIVERLKMRQATEVVAPPHRPNLCRRRAGQGATGNDPTAFCFRVQDARRLAAIRQYAESEECRSRFIRRYFGEPDPPACGLCDRCQPR